MGTVQPAIFLVYDKNKEYVSTVFNKPGIVFASGYTYEPYYSMLPTPQSAEQPDSHGFNPAHVGSSFDDFLKDEGIYEEVRAASIERVQKWVDEQPDSAAPTRFNITAIGDSIVFSENANGEFVYAHELRDPKPQRITEQDALGLIQAYALSPAHDADEWFAEEGRNLLAKLNDHREPDLDYKAQRDLLIDCMENIECFPAIYATDSLTLERIKEMARTAIAQCEGENNTPPPTEDAAGILIRPQIKLE